MEPRKAAIVAATATFAVGIAVLILGEQGGTPINAPTWWLVFWGLFAAPAIIGAMVYVRVRGHNAMVRHLDATRPGWRAWAVGLTVVLVLGAAAFNVAGWMRYQDQLSSQDDGCAGVEGPSGDAVLAFAGPEGVVPLVLPSSGQATATSDRYETPHLLEVTFHVESPVALDRVSFAARNGTTWYHGGSEDAPVNGQNSTHDLSGLAPLQDLEWEVRLDAPAEEDLSVRVSWTTVVCQTE